MKKLLCFMLTIILILGLVACGGGNTNPNVTAPGEPVETKPNNESVSLSKTDSSAAIVDMTYRDNHKNVMFSPLSLDMALAMAAEGAGEQKYIFDKFLNNDNYMEHAKRYFERLDQLNIESDEPYNSYKNVFEIANALWLDETLTFKNEYSSKLMNYYAENKTLNFVETKESADKINAWAEQKTHGMIPVVVTESDFTADTKLVITNAVYFESPWIEKWNVTGQEYTFTKLDGSEIQLQLMSNQVSHYYENKHATAFGASYRNGFLFIGILPKNEGEFNLQDLDIDGLLKSDTTKYDVNAKMPKFKFENTIDQLKNYLIELGYDEMFTDDALSEVAMMGNSDFDMYISKIIQADAIELDENGTKAAAVTAIIADGNAAVMDEPKTKDVVLDRPFAFIIYDPVMEQIVFLGKVVDPT